MRCSSCRTTVSCLSHPYDDPKVIAGQGTIGIELLEDDPELDVVVIPIGGGGLISGIATALKAMKPQIEVLGVEAALFPSMWNALHGEQRPCAGTTIAEGIAVKNVGKLALPIVKNLVSDIVLASEAHLERAVNAFLTLQKTMAEGAGAAGLAALLAEPDRFHRRRVGIVVCGGNIDPRVAASIMVRELEARRPDRELPDFDPGSAGNTGRDRDTAWEARRQHSGGTSPPLVPGHAGAWRTPRRNRRDTRSQPRGIHRTQARLGRLFGRTDRYRRGRV